MANISRDTYELNKLKHYVSVRLQQGVPLVDADWNEKDDIRRYELKSFIKWFIGDGVPLGNDGFRIESIADKLILTPANEGSGKSSIKIDLEKSTAAKILGFGPENYQAERYSPPLVQLTGKVAGPFNFQFNEMKLVVSVNELREETVIFPKKDNVSTEEVVKIINDAVEKFNASVGEPNSFDIKGGDGTAEGAGRCLVDGWDAINECNLTFKSQRLYENDDLANAWGVPKLKETDLDPGNRTDLIYLDVWEREVDSEENPELVNNTIGIETCVRFKREWVVRIIKGNEDPPGLPEPINGDHVFYPLAYLRWDNTRIINQEKITDLRKISVKMCSEGHNHDDKYISYIEDNYFFKKRKIVQGTFRPLDPNHPRETGPIELIIDENIHNKVIRIRGNLKFVKEDYYFQLAKGPEEIFNISSNTGAESWIIMRENPINHNYELETQFKCSSSYDDVTGDLQLYLDSDSEGHLFGIIKSIDQDIPVPPTQIPQYGLNQGFKVGHHLEATQYELNIAGNYGVIIRLEICWA